MEKIEPVDILDDIIFENSSRDKEQSDKIQTMFFDGLFDNKDVTVSKDKHGDYCITFERFGTGSGNTIGEAILSMLDSYEQQIHDSFPK